MDASGTKTTLEHNYLSQSNMNCKIVLLRLKQVQARIGLGRSSIYALGDKSSAYHDPSFPKSIKISAHAIGWLEHEIDEWLHSRIAASRSQ